MAVTAEIEQNGARYAFLLAPQRLVDRAADHVIRFRGRQNALGTRELDAGFKLRVCV